MNRKRKIRLTGHERRATSDERIGSALILTVVLTSLLAIVGVLFLMMARVNRVATSGLSESKELDTAIETIIAKISQDLVLDVPGVSATNPDYYDYPGQEDKWLASLEPHKDGTVYRWRQISDVYKKLSSTPLTAEIISDYQDVVGEGTKADADGDGVADSKWIKLDDIASSKGEPFYAAIRIVDNGGMLNINTAYMFDPNSTTEDRIDGSSLMQINLMGLSDRDQTHTHQEKINRLWSFRAGLAPNDIPSYEQNVVWQYGNPTDEYIPFDISDELKLRNRYILNYNLMTSRIEKLWTDAYDVGPRVPLPTTSYPFSRWSNCTVLGTVEPNDYDYRHISTIYNMDRIIDPNGDKMFNINTVGTAGTNTLYSTIRSALTDYDPNFADVNSVAAQIAVNLKDYIDSDSDITSFAPDVNGPAYYGFERPCIYISELAHNFKKVLVPGGMGSSPGFQYITYKSYAIELHSPYPGDAPDPNQWLLMVGGQDYDITNWSPGEKFHVILNNNPNAPLEPSDSNVVVGNTSLEFKGNDLIELQRLVGEVWITVDSMYVPEADDISGWLDEDAADGVARSIQRDINPHKCIRRLWATAAEVSPPTLGGNNGFSGDPNVIQAHPANKTFTNIGEIGMVFRKPAYYKAGQSVPVGGVIGYGDDSDTEAEVRVDMAESEFRQLFNYLTVIDPENDGIDNDGDGLPDGFDFVGPEWKVPGRININTAPWFVLAQLPWMQYQDSNTIPFERAKAISDKRDEPSQQGFWNIGELMLVNKMKNLDEDGKNNWNGDTPKGPDLTYDDALDDFEERDLIFTRISNLVTVRSDVFTAYILVRIGADGPQKRVIAILDRSDVYSPTDKVKIVAVQPVPDPR